MTPEGKELKAVTAWLKEAKLPYIRMALQPGVAAGWPDLLILPPGGLCFFIEMKAPGKKPNPLQERRLDLLNNFRYIHGWFDNAPDAIDFITRNVSTLLDRWHAAGGASLSALAATSLHEPGGGVPGDA